MSQERSTAMAGRDLIGQIGVVAVLGNVIDGNCLDSDVLLVQVRTAVEALIRADKEYNAALAAIEDHHRSVAHMGYADGGFFLTRELGERLVKARMARDAVLDCVGASA